LKVTGEVKKVIVQERKVKLQYLEAVDPITLKPAVKVQRGTMLALAAHLDGVRLIDNVVV
jgi:pantothenate synthetase